MHRCQGVMELRVASDPRGRRAEAKLSITMGQPNHDKPSHGAVRIATTRYGTQFPPTNLNDNQFNCNLYATFWPITVFIKCATTFTAFHRYITSIRCAQSVQLLRRFLVVVAGG